MVPLFVIMTIIFVWCFYFRFIKTFIRGRGLNYVEVQSFDPSHLISRKEAKSNLCQVLEDWRGQKIDNEIFDKYYYFQRERKLLVDPFLNHCSDQ